MTFHIPKNDPVCSNCAHYRPYSAPKEPDAIWSYPTWRGLCKLLQREKTVTRMKCRMFEPRTTEPA